MIHLIHGIHTSETDGTVAGLMPYLQSTGETVRYERYGYALAILTAIQNPFRAARLAKQVSTGDICVGHSNGCDLIWRMLELGAPIKGAILINPALDVDIKFAPQLEWAYVLYNSGDEAVGWANKLFLFDHPWGPMGRDGYLGDDSRIKNVNCGLGINADPVSAVDGHSDIFSPEKLKFWGPWIARTIESEFRYGITGY